MASIPQFSRDYNGAIEALNSLQSNAKTLAKQKQDKSRSYTRGVVEVRQYASRVGLESEQLLKLNAIHVAGSKGKGSTSAMVEALLRKNGSETGRKTGLYSSPHLIEARERIRIDGAPISQQLFSKYFWMCWDLLTSNKSTDAITPELPTYFRYLTIMAFKVFYEEGVDVAVVEVGIGGKYDATNILDQPSVCAITQLGLEHTAILGDTLTQIAHQKAGIMKGGVPVIAMPQEQEATDELLRSANTLNALLAESPNFTDYENSAAISLGIEGPHQRKNAALALQLAHVWEFQTSKAKGSDISLAVPELSVPKPDQKSMPILEPFALTPAVIDVLNSCRWPGRSQVFEENGITWFMDGAHTLDSCKACAIWFRQACEEGLENSKEKPIRVLVFNCTGDRHPEYLMEHYAGLGFDSAVFCTGMSSAPTNKADQDNRMVEHATKIERCKECKQQWDTVGWSDSDQTPVSPSVYAPFIEDALSCIEEYRKDREVQVLVTGSLHLVGSFLYKLNKPVV